MGRQSFVLLTVLTLSLGQPFLPAAQAEPAPMVKASKQLLRTLNGHENSVDYVQFSPDGKELISQGDDEKNLRFWDVASGQLKRTLREENWIESVAISANGKLIATAYRVGNDESTIHLWDATTLKVIKTFDRLDKSAPIGPDGKPLRPENFLMSVALSPNGRVLATSGLNESVQLWDTSTGKQIGTLKGEVGRLTIQIRFSPDGRTLLTEGGKVIERSTFEERGLKLWDVSSAQVVKVLNRKPIFDFNLTFSPDMKTLYTSSYSDGVHIWDTSAEQQKPRIFAAKIEATSDAEVQSLSLSPDGKTLATGRRNGSIQLWDPESGQLIMTLKGHESGVSSLMFSPDGQTLASGSFDKTVKLWKIAP
jgi:WD40 repeat protein